jgi:beta-hydroxylase
VVLFFDVDRPLRLPGRIVNRLLIAIMKRTAYVQDAHRNLAQWERREQFPADCRDAA